MSVLNGAVAYATATGTPPSIRGLTAAPQSGHSHDRLMKQDEMRVHKLVVVLEAVEVVVLVVVVAVVLLLMVVVVVVVVAVAMVLE